MIKTLILNAESMVLKYRENMMEHLNATQDDFPPEEFAGDLLALGQSLTLLSSKDNKHALSAFRKELRAGFTMMMLSNEEFDQLESWYNDEEIYQAAIFRSDGSPVGLFTKDDLNW